MWSACSRARHAVVPVPAAHGSLRRPFPANDRNRRMRETRQVRWLAGAGAVIVAAATITMAAGTAQAAEGNILAAGLPQAIPGSYIVKLKDFSTASADSLASKFGTKVDRTYEGGFKGFATSASRSRRS